jgi:hypothetical protein
MPRLKHAGLDVQAKSVTVGPDEIPSLIIAPGTPPIAPNIRQPVLFAIAPRGQNPMNLNLAEAALSFNTSKTAIGGRGCIVAGQDSYSLDRVLSLSGVCEIRGRK